MEIRDSPDIDTPFLDTVEGEISFFRSIMRARPIGLHRHFHALSMRTAIHQDTGQYVTIDDIWEKLQSCYDIEALENLVRLHTHTHTHYNHTCPTSCTSIAHRISGR
jgi:MRG-binding protein